MILNKAMLNHWILHLRNLLNGNASNAYIPNRLFVYFIQTLVSLICFKANQIKSVLFGCAWMCVSKSFLKSLHILVMFNRNFSCMNWLLSYKNPASWYPSAGFDSKNDYRSPPMTMKKSSGARLWQINLDGYSFIQWGEDPG
jgi:hypothetical protein